VFILFSTDTSKPDNADDVLTAIKLALQMKFAWKRRLVELEKSIEIKQHIELAVGINQGQMAAFTNDQEEIEGIEGYEINYAKRVESFSRIGKYTNIFLSEKTRNIFKSANMIFEKYEDCDLRGIDEHVNLYEVKEFLFQSMPSIYDEAMSQLFQRIRKDRLLASGKSWLEQYMINILFNTYCQKKLDHYKEKILEFINDSYHRDLLFYRFLKAYLLEDEFLFLKLQYYQEIVKERPSYTLARKEIIRLYEHLCDKVNKIEPLALQVKNYIDELMKFHLDLIEQNEREMYGKILSRINSLIPS
jgi:hypothetical protein